MNMCQRLPHRYTEEYTEEYAEVYKSIVYLHQGTPTGWEIFLDIVILHNISDWFVALTYLQTRQCHTILLHTATVKSYTSKFLIQAHMNMQSVRHTMSCTN